MPYLSPRLTGQKLLVGANFASAGVGVLNDTEIEFVNIIRMFEQLDNFQEYQERVRALLGRSKTRGLINEALVLMVVGSNDFINNYYLIPHSPRSHQYSPPDYVNFVIKNLLMRLYGLGARRVLVTGAPSLGCTPGELAQRSKDGECWSELEQAASLFNSKLTHMLQELNSKYKSDAFIAVDIQQIHSDFLNDPQAHGFVDSKTACCGQGPYNGIPLAPYLCSKVSHLCPNRDIYLFWDAFHPTERACRLFVDQILNGSTKYINPMNLSTILALDSRN